MTSSFAYLFEAKGIQKYILDSGRLADLIGASDLLADLCTSQEDDLLAEILQAVGNPECKFSRRAGGSFCIHSKDKQVLEQLRALWRLAVGIRMPGLPFTDCAPVQAGGEPDELAAAYAAQPGLRENDAAFLPPTGGPMTAFNPRTGRAATGEDRARGGECVLTDALTGPQRSWGKELASAEEADRLARAFLPEHGGETYIFPRHFETQDANLHNPAFPFGTSSDHRVAVVHADISGLGQVFRAVTAGSNAATVRAVASAIETAIVRAARKAAGAFVLPFSAKPSDPGFEMLFGKDPAPDDRQVVPARPVVLGGDDITIIVRADLAVALTEALLKGIEEETALAFREMLQTQPGMSLPAQLSACAGVAVVASGHPFLAAHRMAEDMCGLSKKIAKAGRDRDFPSCLSFAVISSTIDESFGDYRSREQMTADGLALNAKTYLVTGDPVAPSLATLRELARAIDQAPGHGKLISALGRRHEDKAAAELLWQRYRDVLGKDREACEGVRTALGRFFEAGSDEESWPELDAALPFLNDALELVDLGGPDFGGGHG